MFEDTITYSFVNLFTNEDVISRTTRASYDLGRGDGYKMTEHLSSMGKKTLEARALGYAMGDELHQCDVRRDGKAGSRPALGFGIGNFFKVGVN